MKFFSIKKICRKIVVYCEKSHPFIIMAIKILKVDGIQCRIFESVHESLLDFSIRSLVKFYEFWQLSTCQLTVTTAQTVTWAYFQEKFPFFKEA